MLQSLKSIFSNSDITQEQKNKDIDILSGLMIEAAYTDGNISQDEINKISSSLINIFKEDPQLVENSLSKALENIVSVFILSGLVKTIWLEEILQLMLSTSSINKVDPTVSIINISASILD